MSTEIEKIAAISEATQCETVTWMDERKPTDHSRIGYIRRANWTFWNAPRAKNTDRYQAQPEKPFEHMYEHRGTSRYEESWTWRHEQVARLTWIFAPPGLQTEEGEGWPSLETVEERASAGESRGRGGGSRDSGLAHLLSLYLTGQSVWWS
jgi:hypothetical protein